MTDINSPRRGRKRTAPSTVDLLADEDRGEVEKAPIAYIGTPHFHPEKLISFKEFAARLLNTWKYVVVVLFLMWMYTIHGLLNTVPSYTTTLQIAPRTGDQMPTMQQSTLGGLSRLLGLQTGPTTTFGRFLEEMRSVRMAHRLQEKYGLMQEVFAGVWDPKSNTWIRPPARSWSDRVAEFFGIPTWAPPSEVMLAGFLRSIAVKPSKENDIVALTFQSPDRAFAQRLLSTVFDETEAMLRDKARAQAQARIDYLSRKLATTTVSEHRSVLMSLLSYEEQNLVLLDNNQPFAAEVIDGPYSTDLPTQPNPVQSLTLATVAAIILGVVIGLVIEAIRHRER